ncbi:hypothetical protein LVB87_05225 [Lysobacter sp. KIS68-7]|uniref:tetratricopeptide repeat protein n=1 Tax=Lysobacter sp. KIS68-7 TaxID=2904252 RepID=UPI001E52D8E2|nr:tetratricopeptide repeat protein [Lysobacter sp. KIS68-7]UHQ20558.1 hypothetical protein LVB87_05225 [Lysobacter sp. KIS68-7]
MAQVTSMRAPLVAAIALALGLAALPALAQDPMLLRQQARELAWAGRTGQALHLLDQHLAQHPDDRDALLDRARWLAWNGDYAASIESLDKLGGDDAEMRALRARVQAWAGRRDAALALNTPLYDREHLAVQPYSTQVASASNDAIAAPTEDEYGIAWTQALAERLGERPELALEPLATVQRLQPGSKDTLSLEDAVRLPLYSYIGMPASTYTDSDDIDIRGRSLEANMRVSDLVRVLADGTRRTHQATLNGPFAPIGGGDSIDEMRAGVGARLSLTTDVAIEAWGGTSRLDFQNSGSDSAAIGRLLLSHRATDDFSYTAGLERDRVAYSPRALSLGIMRDSGYFDARLTPTLRDNISVRLAADNFSDNNRRHAITADWRHQVYRGTQAYVDVGVQGDWLGYSGDPHNGYYSPSDYRRFAPIVSSYIAFGPEVSLYLSGAVGVQRDETFDGWKRATDFGVGLTFGIFSHWQVVANAGYSERLNEFGKYNGRSFGVQMRYRFCEFNMGRCP